MIFYVTKIIFYHMRIWQYQFCHILPGFAQLVETIKSDKMNWTRCWHLLVEFLINNGNVRLRFWDSFTNRVWKYFPRYRYNISLNLLIFILSVFVEVTMEIIFHGLVDKWEKWINNTYEISAGARDYQIGEPSVGNSNLMK